MATNYSVNEVFYEINDNDLIGNSAVQFVFSPLELYNNGGEVIEPYIHRADDRVVNADIAFLKLNTFVDPLQEAPTGFTDGNFKGTNVAGAFFATTKDDYFYYYTNTDSLITAPTFERSTSTPKLAEVIKIPNGSSGGTFETKSLGMQSANVNRFDDIEVDGLNEGVKPNAMSMMAIRLEDVKAADVTYRCFDTATISTDGGEDILAANTIKLEADGQAVRSFAGIKASGLEEKSNDFVYNTMDGGLPADGGSYSEANDYVSAVEIVNIEREVDDERYGDTEDDLPFIFTGASYYFSNDQIDNNVANNPDAVNIDVWGGDCFIGLHTFKITDSCYSLTDSEKEPDLDGAKGDPADQTSRWGYYFNKNSNNDQASEDMSRPYPLKGVSQTITVLLESEINPEFAEKTQHNTYAATPPVPKVSEAGQIRSKFNYYYHLDYTSENKYKVFSPYQDFDLNKTEFGARVGYSDQKVYNTDIEGFDRFRVLNFYDMDESNGSVSKLIELGDRIFALQESAVSYLPITAQTIQTADGSGLSIRSGEIIGIPNKINTLYGTQHPATVKVDGTSAFFVDQLRGEVCGFDGQQVSLISRTGMDSYFTTKLKSLGLNDLTAVYDNKNKEYLLFIRETEGVLYSSLSNAWVARLPEDVNTSTLGGVRVADKMLLVGVTSGEILQLSDLYESDADVGEWFGINRNGEATIVINQEPEAVKTFDGITVISDRIIDPIDFTVIKSDGTSSIADLSAVVINDKEGTFRLKNLRDASGARSRGVYGEFNFYLNPLSLADNAKIQNGTTSVLTKYRTSKRPI